MTDQVPAHAFSSPEVSIVMPCLNEADTVGICIEKALRASNEHRIRAEIIVADNGSTDGCQAIAARLGARVIEVRERGYGNALMGGIAAARGRFVIMGDADDSYDFLEIPTLVKKLREGADLVQGCRLPSGGGTIMPGAMPFLHRVVGNPMFSLARQLLRAGGFEILRTDFLFIFPRALRWLRWAEPLCSHLPLGAQYQILCRRPSSNPAAPWRSDKLSMRLV